MMINVAIALGLLLAGHAGEKYLSNQDQANEEAACLDKTGRRIDIRRVKITLNNRRVISGQHYIISGTNIIITNDGRLGAGALIYDARFLVSARTSDGVKLFHATLKSKPYIYWIEGDSPRLARNGMLSIADRKVSLACEGTISR